MKINNFIYNFKELKVKKPPIIFLMGHTALGKTKLSFLLKNNFPIEIISVDSTLVFRDMNIGTAKPNFNELIRYPHKLINIRDPVQKYSSFDFYKDSLYEIKKALLNKKIPLLVGGSMFYFKVLLDGINLKNIYFLNLKIKNFIESNIFKNEKNFLFNKIKKNINLINKINFNDIRRCYREIESFLLIGNKNKKFIKKLDSIENKYKVYQIILFNENKYNIYKKIKYRFYKMINNGFENEVFNLYKRGDLNLDTQSIKSIGYNQMWLYLSNKISYKEMILNSINSTKRLMKHQITWLNNWKFYTEKCNNNNTNKLINFISKIIENYYNKKNNFYLN